MMIDFHSHILPEMDDGAESLETSLAMLRESKRQGVDVICSTSHFYADEEDPHSFLSRRGTAYLRLCSAMGDSPDYPKIVLGAEVLYFPGISVADEIKALRLMGTPFLLIEPPMPVVRRYVASRLLHILTVICVCWMTTHFLTVCRIARCSSKSTPVSSSTVTQRTMRWSAWSVSVFTL